MESTLRNMILTLFAITFVGSCAVGAIYLLTKEPIETAKKEKVSNAIGMVVPEFTNDPSEDTIVEEQDGGQLIVYTAKNGEDVVGYAIETYTNNGFSGDIKLMVGFLPDGTIHNIQVLEQNETPGLGSKMADPGNKLIVSFEGKKPSELNMRVAKEGGDIDALTASTISSKAYVEAVQRAYDKFLTIVK
ncbi:MAG: RnfABCDGE type electron transport complex subunit G [Rikenellaceae bacterium]|nr:RnfABCDGE type electron transport complex subunit G [Rikenellaceae bacterium]